MDVKYIPSDWEKMKTGIGDLIGLGRWGKGMIDELKDVSGNLEDAKSDIDTYDSDGVIDFEYTSQKGKYQELFEDFKVLHHFSGKVSDIVNRTIDEPFYQDMDAFVESIRNLSISTYTTTNRIGATEIRTMYAGYGAQQTLEVPKAKVSLEDLFSGDHYYSQQMKLEFEAWKKLNPNQDFTQREYQLAALNSRDFEYESIKDSQENKEFWGQIAALVVIVGVSLVCLPAGMALGAVYGSLELNSAVSGKDWISGRELGTTERWVRGLLSPLDIVPGVSSIAKFSSTARTINLGKNAALFGMNTGVKTTIQRGIVHIDDMVREAGKLTANRLRNASSAIKDGANVMKSKLIKVTIEAADLADEAVTYLKKHSPSLDHLAATPEGQLIRMEPENTHAIGNKVRDLVSKMNGVNVESTKGTGNKIDSDTIKKYIRDIEGRTGRELPKNQIEKLKEALRNKEYKKMSPIETAKHRAEFDKVKNKVIKEWEENTGQKWPEYNENVISEKTGKIIRKKGDKYDAHHIIENTFGGEHEWWNMHPTKFPNEHQAGIHGTGSPANTLFKGGKK